MDLTTNSKILDTETDRKARNGHVPLTMNTRLFQNLTDEADPKKGGSRRYK